MIERMLDLNERANRPVPKVDQAVQQMQITGIHIPFTDLVWFLVKLALALVPAGIVVSIFYYLIIMILFGH